MRFPARILFHILANGLAIILANRLLPGFIFYGDWVDLIIASAVLGIVNSFIKPILKLLTFPVIILTLGIFSIIINIFLLYLVAGIVHTIQIDGFWAAFWAVIIISITNNIIFSIAKQENK